VLRRGERARWWLLIVYEHAMLPARNKVGPCLVSLVQTYHAAVLPHKFILVCFGKFYCKRVSIFDIDNDKGWHSLVKLAHALAPKEQPHHVQPARNLIYMT
jgi:hypothetical protein